ncbi:MAG: hypothetical protein ACREX9_14855 [Gammaproteobacteria bacterium]
MRNASEKAQPLGALLAPVIEPDQVEAAFAVCSQVHERVVIVICVIGRVGARNPGIATIRGDRGGQRPTPVEAAPWNLPNGDEALSGRRDLHIVTTVDALVQRRLAGVDSRRRRPGMASVVKAEERNTGIACCKQADDHLSSARLDGAARGGGLGPAPRA